MERLYSPVPSLFRVINSTRSTRGTLIIFPSDIEQFLTYLISVRCRGFKKFYFVLLRVSHGHGEILTYGSLIRINIHGKLFFLKHIIKQESSEDGILLNT